MDRSITVLLKYVTQLINIGRTHILFDHRFFKTELFLNYREALGTFCSTHVNVVSKSLNSVLTELSSKLNNLHSYVNGHKKTSMYFLRSNCRQIYDNVVTVKNDVTRTTTVSDMRFFFNYFPRYERGYNSPEPL